MIGRDVLPELRRREDLGHRAYCAGVGNTRLWPAPLEILGALFAWTLICVMWLLILMVGA